MDRDQEEACSKFSSSFGSRQQEVQGKDANSQGTEQREEFVKIG